MTCAFVQPLCDAVTAVQGAWGGIVFWLYAVAAVVALIVVLLIVALARKAFGQPGAWTALASAALALAFALGRASVKRVVGDPARELTKADIAALQAALNAKDFNAGLVDGVFGQNSEKALIAFQRSRGERGTGRPTAAQLKALGV